MGIRRYITLGILLFTTLISAQQYQVIYNLEYQPKLNSDKEVSEEVKLLIDYTHQVSYFQNLGEEKIKAYYKKYNDQVKAGTLDYSQVIEAPDYGFNFAFYKQTTKDSNLFYEKILGDTYSYSYSEDLSWKIKAETKDILGYKTQKAITTLGDREWVAWFSHDIPISDGPYKFEGLPGLILEVSSADNAYSFVAKSFTQTEEEIVLPKSTEIKRNALITYKKKLLKKPSLAMQNRIENGGPMASISFNGKTISQKDIMDSMDEKVKEWILNHDNPIEKDMIWIKR
ncbi:GLPGLI family protein [Flavobacteriaceae bacterium Ap0902]|nr:GLPGLI family protein [Flavobacteriaceae bacterium Ap0902]